MFPLPKQTPESTYEHGYEVDSNATPPFHAPKKEQCEIFATLTRWRLMRTALGTIHVVGIDEHNQPPCGRISSPILAMDFEHGYLISAGGKKYRLDGGPCVSAEFAHRAWAAFSPLLAEDVTSQLTAADIRESK